MDRMAQRTPTEKVGLGGLLSGRVRVSDLTAKKLKSCPLFTPSPLHGLRLSPPARKGAGPSPMQVQRRRFKGVRMGGSGSCVNAPILVTGRLNGPW